MPWRKLGGVRGRAAGALPAAVGGEHVAQRRQAVVVGGELLVVDHEEPLWPGADLVGHLADRGADLLLRGGRNAGRALRLMGEDARGATAGPGLGRGCRAGAAHADEQAAVRAAQRRARPVLTDLLLDEKVAMRAVAV